MNVATPFQLFHNHCEDQRVYLQLEVNGQHVRDLRWGTEAMELREIFEPCVRILSVRFGLSE
jgi:hypothetical protein